MQSNMIAFSTQHKKPCKVALKALLLTLQRFDFKTRQDQCIDELPFTVFCPRDVFLYDIMTHISKQTHSLLYIAK